jgi:hypothetical protein
MTRIRSAVTGPLKQLYRRARRCECAFLEDFKSNPISQFVDPA